MKRLLFSPGIVLLLLSNVLGQSQQTQTAMTLTGAVYDWNGSVIVNGTKVSAEDRNGKKFDAATNNEGIYSMQLPLGVYTVEAIAPGFCPTRVRGFRVVNATHGRMSLDFVLEVGGSHQQCVREIRIKKKSRRGIRRNSMQLNNFLHNNGREQSYIWNRQA